MQPTEQQIEQAKAVLEAAGYFIRNLWHIDEVDYDEFSADEQLEILEVALTDDYVMQTINDLIETTAVERWEEEYGMTEEDIVQEFVDTLLPMIRMQEQCNPDSNGYIIDKPMRREAFNNYVDALCKDGRIGESMADKIVMPDWLEEKF